jgi:energy-coupling factor transporter transmembrane protein EcfT
VAALQRLEHLIDQWTQIQQARRARGVGADGNPVRWVAAMSGGAFALFVGAMRSSAQLAVAMDARGFATAQGRTWAEPAPWRFPDTIVVVLSIGLAVIPWLV